MKNDADRKAMVAMVQATFNKYRSFMDLPEYKGPALPGSQAVMGSGQTEYVEALYEFCGAGFEPVGRVGGSIVGK